ncbi:ATP dependent RNA helicase [Naegleria gruberi]|uniref:RNA helicase n=1 Tax=Naegleria gruberi TaxID=5762 RepID=D2V563_NAEGR|nr:ATP dependent RNA helicase [Naegleria gruberi]EFC48221.1 ATP dependent RNA helicase [Naegleria gruberi]|eukprot:XP_002680965.1 ATP dependent RNA helicase [Naegleria gruberi strain NEG-M]
MRKLIASSSTFHKGCIKNQLLLLNTRLAFLNSIRHFSTSTFITNNNNNSNSEDNRPPHKKSFNNNKNQHHYSHNPHNNDSYKKRDTNDNFKYFDEDSSTTKRRNDNNNRRQRNNYNSNNRNDNNYNNNNNSNRNDRFNNSKQFNQRRNNFDISRPVDNSVENEVNSMVNRLLSKSRPSVHNKNNQQNNFSENKYKDWSYPTVSAKCPENLDFKKNTEQTLVTTVINAETVERFKSFMLNHVKNNLNFKSKCKSIHYELIFEIFCSEIVVRSNNDPDFAALVEDILAFHPENIIQSNVSDKKDESLFSNVSDFLFYDFSAITDMALSHSNFSNEVSVWFNTFVQQRYPEDYHLYTEALKTCDMTNPFNYYKKSIPFGRKIIYHMGPTNSGKTHAALTRLSQSENGVYCGPLRLLAQEVFTKMNTQYGCKCNLMTGQERRIIPGANHVACTIEMADLNEVYDVAVVDEIQMISDNQRGAAWTRALLGLQAREIHICGDGSALTIVKNLIFGGDNKLDAEIEVVESENPNYDPTSESDNVDSNQNLYHYHQPVAANKLLQYTKSGIADSIDVIPYTRMKPLEISSESLQGSVQNIKDFDCIVTFSRNEIYEIKKMIEINTGIRCCVIYGALPPEVRTEQAELFNDSGNQDPEENGGQRDFTVLVASDAVGMGLNLNIKRVVFYRMTKYDYSKGGVAPLDVSLVKQIAGRAGRRGFHEIGQVTTFYENDLQYLHQCMNIPNEEITKAGLFPEWDQVESFSKVYKAKELANNPEGSGISLYEVLEKFFALSRIHKDFFFCDVQQVLDLATSIDDAGPKLTLKQKFDFVNAPVPGFDRAKEMHIRYVEDFSNPNIAAVPLNIDMENILRILDKIREKAKVTEQGFVNSVSVYLQEALKNIEFYHRMIDLYLWLANRYPLRFDKEAAEQAREVLMTELTESLLNQTEENKKIKSVGLLKENAPRAFEYVTFKRNNVRNEEPLDPSLQGLKRVIIGGKEYFKKNQFQVISRDKVTRDLVDVMVDSMDEATSEQQQKQQTKTTSSTSQQ